MRVLCGAIYIKFRSVLIKTTRPGPSHDDVIFVGVLAMSERAAGVCKVMLLEGWLHGTALRICKLRTNAVCTGLCQKQP